jgi:hypothetical protein
MSPAPARPEFDDPLLKEALEESAPAIENFVTKIDKLSNDIKMLEAYLERSAVRVVTTVRFPAPQEAIDEYLSWDKGEPDRWRIVYHRPIHNPGEFMADEHRTVLIEASLDVRVRSRKVLPMLLRAVADVARLGEEGVPRKTKSTRVIRDRGWEVEEKPAESAPAASPPAADDDIPF